MARSSMNHILIGMLSLLSVPSFAAAANPDYMSRSSLRQLDQSNQAFQRPVTNSNQMINIVQTHNVTGSIIYIPRAPITPLNSDGGNCSIFWAIWWGRYSNAKLNDISTPTDKMHGIVRFETRYEGRFGATVMKQIPIMVPSNTTEVFVDGYSVPRDPDRSSESCVQELQKGPLRVFE